jgi:hypothetical protein
MTWAPDGLWLLSFTGVWSRLSPEGALLQSGQLDIPSSSMDYYPIAWDETGYLWTIQPEEKVITQWSLREETVLPAATVQPGNVPLPSLNIRLGSEIELALFQVTNRLTAPMTFMFGDEQGLILESGGTWAGFYSYGVYNVFVNANLSNPVAYEGSILLLPGYDFLWEVVENTSEPGQNPPGSPQPPLAYLLPLPEPVDVVFDEALKVLYDDQLVTLELVAGEQRFRSSQNEAGFSNSNSLAWDERRNLYWSVRGASYWVGYEIDQLDAQGNVLATYTVPEMIGYPRYITLVDGFLWVTSDKGGIHKLEVVEGSSELKVVDSFAVSLGKFPSSVVDGIDWDGESLWVLSDDVVTRLGLSMQPACTIILPSEYPQPSWYGYNGLAWDGEYLWVGHAEQNMLYRIDPASCQEK